MCVRVSNLATFEAAGSRVLASDRVKGIYIHFDPNNPGTEERSIFSLVRDFQHDTSSFIFFIRLLFFVVIFFCGLTWSTRNSVFLR